MINHEFISTTFHGDTLETLPIYIDIYIIIENFYATTHLFLHTKM
jgi:hypothetical protein